MFVASKFIAISCCSLHPTGYCYVPLSPYSIQMPRNGLSVDAYSSRGPRHKAGASFMQYYIGVSFSVRASHSQSERLILSPSVSFSVRASHSQSERLILSPSVSFSVQASHSHLIQQTSHRPLWALQRLAARACKQNYLNLRGRCTPTGDWHQIFVNNAVPISGLCNWSTTLENIANGCATGHLCGP
jgi:hypothetical protein